MHCLSCGKETTGSDAGCSHCGALLPLRCSGCGAFNPGNATYCGGCGEALPGAATSSSASDRRRTSSRPIPLGAGSLSSEGALKQVTVLFADLGGSFYAIQGADPEEAEALLDSVVSVMTDAVLRFDGTVNQVLGDGIMAVFGAPVAHEDHAVRAACASLAMRTAIRRLSNPSWAARGLRPEIRVGLNSGEVVVRSVRNALTVEYRAIGSTTHLAARMEQMALPGSILLTEDVMRLGRGMLRARSLGPLDVRGLAAPVHVHELTGVATRTRFQATIARGLSPLVGRDSALSGLSETLRGAMSGRSAAALVTGEPGIGKSRLCHELLRGPDASPCRVLEASALSYTSSTPHSLLAGLLKSLFEINDDDNLLDAEAKTAGKLAALGLANRAELSASLELLGITPVDDTWRNLEPFQRTHKLEQTTRDLLTRWCDEGPSIVLIEDLHWADPQSRAFLSGLFRAPPGNHTLLLGTSRDEWLDPSTDGLDVKHFTLRPLPPLESEALITALLGGHNSLRHLHRRVAERTAGNPIFVEESVRAYVDMGIVEGGPGAYTLRKDAQDVLVPATIESLVAARLDQTEPSALGLLQAAAVLGDESSVEALQTLAGLTSDAFEAQFATLTGADLLYQTGAFRAPLFRFRHALIRDVAYNRMLRARRRLLHARALETLETLYPARLAEHVERLAEHAHEAEQWTRCAHYHRLACVRAANRWANAQAIDHLDQGLYALSRAEPGRERDVLAIDLRLVALAPLLPLGDHERTISLLQEAETYAQRLGDSTYLAKIYSQLGMALWLRGRHDRAMEVAQRAQVLSFELQHFPLATATRFSIAVIHHARGQLTSAVSMLRKLVSDLIGPMARRRLGWAGYPSVLARAFVISCDGLLGEFKEADRMYAEGRPMADELEHPYSRAMILEEYGFCQLVRGEALSACEPLELAMQICNENEVVVMHAPVAARLGTALVESGRLAEGRAVIENAIARETHRAAGHYAETYLLLALAQAQIRGGEPRAAIETAKRAEEITRLSGERAYHVCATTQIAFALACAHEVTPAFEMYESTLHQAHELEMAPFEALALQGRAAVLADRGDWAGALRDFDAAADIWCRLHAPARVEQVAIERRELTAISRSGT